MCCFVLAALRKAALTLHIPPKERKLIQKGYAPWKSSTQCIHLVPLELIYRFQYMRKHFYMKNYNFQIITKHVFKEKTTAQVMLISTISDIIIKYIWPILRRVILRLTQLWHPFVCL